MSSAGLLTYKDCTLGVDVIQVYVAEFLGVYVQRCGHGRARTAGPKRCSTKANCGKCRKYTSCTSTMECHRKAAILAAAVGMPGAVLRRFGKCFVNQSVKVNVMHTQHLCLN